MELFKEHVYLCDSLEDYKAALEKSLSENSEEKGKQRILFAKSHSWENNVNMIYKYIQKNL
jgi:hypothetical protein